MHTPIDEQSYSNFSFLATLPIELRNIYPQNQQEDRALIEQVLRLSLQQQNKRVNSKKSGLSSKFIKMIRSMKMSISSQHCTVCIQGFKENEIIKKLPCGHILHKECAKQYLKIYHICPICRQDLEKHFKNLEKQQSQGLKKQIN